LHQKIKTKAPSLPIGELFTKMENYILMEYEIIPGLINLQNQPGQEPANAEILEDQASEGAGNQNQDLRETDVASQNVSSDQLGNASSIIDNPERLPESKDNEEMDTKPHTESSTEN
jgi:hypothetical protein